MNRALLKAIVTIVGLFAVYAATQNLQSVAKTIGDQRIDEHKERSKESRPKPLFSVDEVSKTQRE